MNSTLTPTSGLSLRLDPVDRAQRELEALQRMSRERRVGFIKVRLMTPEKAAAACRDLRAKLSPEGIRLTVQPAAAPQAPLSTKP